MAKVIIDTTNAPDPDPNRGPSYSGPVPPVALYRALLAKAWWGKTNDGQKDMVTCLFTLEARDNVEKKQYNGYQIWHSVTREPSTEWRMKELFIALGTNPKSGIDFDQNKKEKIGFPVSRIGSARPGQTYVLIKGQADQYKGKDRLIVGNLSPMPGTVQQDVEADLAEEPSEYGPPADESFSASDMPEDPWGTSTGGDEDPPF